MLPPEVELPSAGSGVGWHAAAGDDDDDDDDDEQEEEEEDDQDYVNQGEKKILYKLVDFKDV